MMSYKKAADVLPEELIDLIQNYVDGEYLYIPRKEMNRKAWGKTPTEKGDPGEKQGNIPQIQGRSAGFPFV